MVKIKIFILILLFNSANAFGFERLYSREISLKESSDAVLVLKIAGRVNCLMPALTRKITADSKCHNSNLSTDLEGFNKKIIHEEFLVIHSFKGNKKYGDIIKIKYFDPVYADDLLRLGEMYLVFFHQTNSNYEYEAFDAVEYKNINPLSTKEISFDALVKELLKNQTLFVKPKDFYMTIE